MWFLQGNARYVYISYGMQETVKYLKIVARTSLKHAIKNTILRRKDAKLTENEKRKIAKEFLSKINQGDSVFDL